MLNVEQTRALYRVQRNALVPTVDVNANGTRQRIAFGFAGKGQGSTYNQFNVNLGVAAYELDLFGRVRSLKKQALETYFATEEARKERPDCAGGRSGRGLFDRTRIDRTTRRGPANIESGAQQLRSDQTQLRRRRPFRTRFECRRNPVANRARRRGRLRTTTRPGRKLSGAAGGLPVAG